MNGVLDPKQWSESMRVFAERVGVPTLVLVLGMMWLIALDAGWLPSRTRETSDVVARIAATQLKILEQQTATTQQLARAIEAIRGESRSQVSLATCLAFSRTADIQQQCLEKYRREAPLP